MTIVSSKDWLFLVGFCWFEEEFNANDFRFRDDESDDLELDDDDDEREDDDDDDDEEEVDVELDDVRFFFFSCRFFSFLIVRLNFETSCGWALKGKPEGGGGIVFWKKN